jgi:protein-arginine kinase
MILSTRIRVARNLAAYPLGSGVTKEQIKEVEQHVVNACKTSRASTTHLRP